MNTRICVARSALGLLIAFLFAGWPARAADYESNYAEGIKAIERGQWNDAIRLLRAAVEARPREGGKKILLNGMNETKDMASPMNRSNFFRDTSTLPVDYLPHYYLGVAYAKSGNCLAALEAWAESERQGLLQKTREYNDLPLLRQPCRRIVAQAAERQEPTAVRNPTTRPTAVVSVRIPPTVPAAESHVLQTLREANAELSAAEAASSEEFRYRTQPAERVVWEKDPSLAAREARAKQDLAGARVTLGEAKSRNDVQRLRASADAARRIRQEFDALQRAVNAGREAHATGQAAKNVEQTVYVGPLQREVRDRVNSARLLLSEASRAQQISPAAAAAKAELQRLIQEFARKDAALPAEQLTFNNRLKAAILRLTTALKPPSPPPGPTVPPWLFEAGQAYFEGDYARTIQLLEKVPDSSDDRVKAEAKLFRSAARYSMYVIGGEKDESLHESAVTDAADCRRLDAQVPRNRRVFSPRFIQFFLAANGRPTEPIAVH